MPRRKLGIRQSKLKEPKHIKALRTHLADMLYLSCYAQNKVDSAINRLREAADALEKQK